MSLAESPSCEVCPRQLAFLRTREVESGAVHPRDRAGPLLRPYELVDDVPRRVPWHEARSRHVHLQPADGVLDPRTGRAARERHELLDKLPGLEVSEEEPVRLDKKERQRGLAID